MAPRGPKMADEVWKSIDFWAFGRSRHLSLNRFFDPSTPSMRKGDDGGEKKKKENRGKKKRMMKIVATNIVVG